ncbi:DMT family transporter [Cognatishimia maritima]|uniref:Permease of the drug/metabolite transporter (DMT) superfamily n=1 Tax=Cognatishimia maritima TaxID=870908 RepID=A0A1M5SRN5_9RHOB|nr:DMT family transporter [Cognatishimia maritima]SHH41110.1 Permease of the drug/metabolite transporter (DMT) superfamily [Cognatishimia maritima]
MARADNRLGFLLMTLTSLLFALQDGLSRYLAAEYNVFMIVMIRFWFFAAFALWLARRNGGLQMAIRSRHPWLQIGRGVIIALEICVTVAAFTILGLTETHAIFVCYPLIIIALSGPLLKETIGWRRWAAVLVGFIGVLIIIQPGTGVFSPWAIVPVIGASMFALYGVMTRFVSAEDSATTSFFYTGCVGAVVMTIIGAFNWQPLASQDLSWLLLLCLMGILGHWMLIKTYEVAEASAVQPFAYLQMPFAAMVGFFAFHEEVRVNVIAGAALIICAGLFALWRERQQAV